MELLTLSLPWPPTVNHYWGQRGVRRFLTSQALAFRSHVWVAFKESKHPGFGTNKLALTIALCPPDKRRRDIDNPCKAVFDSLQHAGVFDDDSQIEMLTIYKTEHVESGCKVTIVCLSRL